MCLINMHNALYYFAIRVEHSIFNLRKALERKKKQQINGLLLFFEIRYHATKKMIYFDNEYFLNLKTNENTKIVSL